MTSTRTSTRTRKLLLAAGLVLGAVVPATPAFAFTPPAPVGPGEIALPGQEDDPTPHDIDDLTAVPVDPCVVFGCAGDLTAPAPCPTHGGCGGSGGAAEDPTDPAEPAAPQAGNPSNDTVSGRPDFTG